MVCAVTTPLHSLCQGSPHSRPAGQYPTCEAISPGCKTHFANDEKIFYLQRMCWFVRMWHIPKKSHYARCPALQLLSNSLCGPLTKRELSKTVKLSVFRSVFVPILTCGHESLVTTERILSKERIAEIEYLRIVIGVTLRDKEHRSEIRKAQDFKQSRP